MKLEHAYMAWTADYPNRAHLPRVGHIVVGTKEQIDRECDPVVMGDRALMSSLPVAFTKEPVEMTPTEQALAMLTCFTNLVVREGLDPQDVHTAFRNIDEYRIAITNDLRSAV